MSITTVHCPTCNKLAVEIDKRELSQFTIIMLKCGHSIIERKLVSPELITESADKKFNLFKYQAEDIPKIEQAKGRALLTYEPGLGKTVTAEFFVKNHLTDVKPVLIITKGAVQVQWLRHTMAILGESYIPVPLVNGKSGIIQGLSIYLITFDMCRKLKDKIINELKPALIIIDECQHIKDRNTMRAKAVREICESAKHILALSATPIKNHAGDYFSILNILQPTRFPVYEWYLREHVQEVYQYGARGKKLGGLKNPARFKELTNDFIIYHSREEVLPDLPKERRNFDFLDIDDKEIQKAYDATIDELEDIMEGSGSYDSAFEKAAARNQIIFKLKHLVGLAKCEEAVSEIEEFLLGTDRKLVIFIQHIDVGDIIESRVNQTLDDGGYGYKVLRIPGGLDPSKLDKIKEQFLNGPERVLILSTLAGGEGLNLQPVSDAIFVERQWNSVNEMQAERRFSRPGATAEYISIKYLLAAGTIDDYLTEIIERKRKYVTEAITGEITEDLSENSVLSELASKLVSMGKPKWRL